MSMSLPHAVEAFPKAPHELVNTRQSNATTPLNLNKDAISNTTPINSSRDFITLSEEGKRLSRQSNAERDLANKEAASQKNHLPYETATIKQTQNAPLIYQKQSALQNTESQTLTDEEKKEIEQLKRRDLEVKSHERAHATTGGRHAGAPHYQYETGPNGTRYATDGEVSIDLAEIANNPQATIDKMKQVYRAALAPREPSSADRSIASQAQQTITSARTDLTSLENSETKEESSQTQTMQTPQHKQNINIYKQADSTSKNTFYQLV